MLRLTTKWKICFVCILLSELACEKPKMAAPTFSMPFFGHIYQPGQEDRIDHRLENVNFQKFDAIFLGGDICVETTKNRHTLDYLDQLFDLRSDQTHWSVGNHDVRNGNRNWIEEATGKSSYYFQDLDGLRIIILNTTLDECQEMQEQHSMLTTALEPQQEISHVLIISHHAIWTEYLDKHGIAAQANARHSIWRSFCPFSDASTFEASILPLMAQLTLEGKEVFWIAGDYGQMVSGFQYRSEAGVWFLGNGIAENGRLRPDSILSFTWNTGEKDLSWKFDPVDKFVEKHE